MNIIINENSYQVPLGISVQDIFKTIGIEQIEGHAIAKNEEMIPRSLWEDQEINEGDRFLIIQAIQGG